MTDIKSKLNQILDKKVNRKKFLQLLGLSAATIPLLSPSVAAKFFLRQSNGNLIDIDDLDPNASAPAGSEGEIQFKQGTTLGASNNLYWNNTQNRLGVGTNSPDETLHVVGNTEVDGDFGVTGDAGVIGFVRADDGFQVDGTTVIDSSRNIVNAGTGTFSGTVSAATPVNDTDLSTKAYVDSQIASTAFDKGNLVAGDRVALSGTLTERLVGSGNITITTDPTNLGQGGSGNSRTITSSTGNNVTISTATTTNAGFMSTGDKSKLDGIESGAQVNVGTDLSWTAGTTAGPRVNSSTGNNAVMPSASASASGAVTTGAQTFAGVKTFSSIPLLPSSNPTSDNQAVRKAYVDAQIASTTQGTVTSVGSGDGLSGGPITSSGTLSVDSTVIRTTGNQTLGGTKTFSTIPILPSSNPTSDNQAVRKAYVDAQIAGTSQGTVTSVGSGDGLTGGPITSSGSLSVDSSVVRTGGGNSPWIIERIGDSPSGTDNPHYLLICRLTGSVGSRKVAGTVFGARRSGHSNSGMIDLHVSDTRTVGNVSAGINVRSIQGSVANISLVTLENGGNTWLALRLVVSINTQVWNATGWYFSGFKGTGIEFSLRAHSEVTNVSTFNSHHSSNFGFSGTLQTGTVPWARLSGVPDFASRWPTWGEVTSKPSTFPPSSHTHTWNDINNASVNSWSSLRIQTSHGNIDFGPANTSWAHIYTDRPAFYFNKELYILGTQVVKNSGTWGINITGNAGTATTLQTARSINGTSFNGSSNITTANWGTARTLTIGSTGKSVNGSGNVSWSLAEIGAVPTGRTITINSGSGLSGGSSQSLASNRTWNLAVDSTVIRTTGNQTIAGTKTFSGLIDATRSTSAGSFSADLIQIGTTSGNRRAVFRYYNHTDWDNQSYFEIRPKNNATSEEKIYVMGNGRTGIGIVPGDVSGYNPKLHIHTGNDITKGILLDTGIRGGIIGVDDGGPGGSGGIIGRLFARLIRTDTGAGSGGVHLLFGHTSWSSASDKTLKENITKINHALKKLEKINGYYYDWKNEDSGTKKYRHVGLIAQEVEKVLPEAVSTDKKDNLKSIRYTEIIPLLVQAIKEQQEQINYLLNKVN